MVNLAQTNDDHRDQHPSFVCNLVRLDGSEHFSEQSDE